MIRLSGPLLIVPGLSGSGPGHWQSLWAENIPGASRLEQADWDNPDLDAWIKSLHQAIARRPGSIIVAHSLGAILVSRLAAQEIASSVGGAMLVAPADIERCVEKLPASIQSFLPITRQRLPFPSVVVASTNDPYISLERAHALAASWGSAFRNVGKSGHINTESGHGIWPEGERILEEFFSNKRHRRAAYEPATEYSFFH